MKKLLQNFTLLCVEDDAVVHNKAIDFLIREVDRKCFRDWI